MGFSYPDPLSIQTHCQNPDQLSKFRPTAKTQTHWLGHIVTRNIKKLSLVFINILFIYINLIKARNQKKTMVDRCMRMDSSRCDPNCITLDLRSWVIQLGSQLEEFFLTPVNHTVFLLVLYSHKLCEFKYMNGSILYCIPIYSL